MLATVTGGMAAAALFVKWVYEQAILDGIEKLVSILQPKTFTHGQPLIRKLREQSQTERNNPESEG